MIPPSTYLPRAISSTIAASSIHGMGAQNLVIARRNGCIAVSGTALGPNLSLRRRASSLVSPVETGTTLVAEEVMIQNLCFVGDSRIDRWRNILTVRVPFR